MLSPAEFIAQKRDGLAHQSSDLESWIADYARGQIPDYQMAAWAMAVYLQDMTGAETATLTASMLRSGRVLQWESDGRPVVDKHSTGGVGDKVSLVLAPLLACCDVRVPMISGRGLGPTGGTLDKLEAIPGFSTQMSTEQVQRITNEVGCVIAGASQDIAPADKQLYALRDVTATVASIPLITASIMSKKLAEGLAALVLDVKWGSGAFMKCAEEAARLAKAMVEAGDAMGVAVTALLTNMDQPLGCCIGNALEVDEAVGTLIGGGPNDLRELTLQLGAEALVSSGVSVDHSQARLRLQAALDSGAAMDRLQQMVAAQGGDLMAPRPLAPAEKLLAPVGGFVAQINTEQLGQAVIRLGGGRQAKEDTIDFGVGIEMHTRLGDHVDRGQPLASVFARSADQCAAANQMLLAAIHLSDDESPPPPLILQRICTYNDSENRP